MSTYILSPHFDDAAVNCYSVLNNTGVSVVTVFGASPQDHTVTLWDMICGIPSSRKMMIQRIAENKQALTGFKVQLIDLDFLDNQYRKINISKNDIASKLDSLIPKDSTIFAPLALGQLYSHPDHKLVREAALMLKNRRLIFYPDVPYMKLSTDNNKTAAKIVKLARDSLNIKLKPVINHLTQEDVASKINLIKNYDTQYTMTNLMSFGGLTRIKKLNYELFFNPG